jgi:HEAT repeat protein
MKKKDIIMLYTVAIIAAGLLFSLTCRPKESDEDKKVPDWKTLIVSDIEKERTSALNVVLGNRRKTVEYLLLVVNSAVEEGEPFYSSTTSRNIAISLLGKLRAKEAVEDLTKFLTSKPGQTLFITEARMFSPAGYALVEIGLPSVTHLVELLKSEGAAPLREQCIKIIVSIKGMPETELLLEDVLAKETDDSKRENLKAVQDLLKDPKFRKIVENVYKKINRLE